MNSDILTNSVVVLLIHTRQQPVKYKRQFGERANKDSVQAAGCVYSFRHHSAAFEVVFHISFNFQQTFHLCLPNDRYCHIYFPLLPVTLVRVYKEYTVLTSIPKG